MQFMNGKFFMKKIALKEVRTAQRDRKMSLNRGLFLSTLCKKRAEIYPVYSSVTGNMLVCLIYVFCAHRSPYVRVHAQCMYAH